MLQSTQTARNAAPLCSECVKKACQNETSAESSYRRR